MADNSNRYIPTVTPHEDNQTLPSLQSLNDIIRALQMDIYAIEGRLGESTCRDAFRILGKLTIEAPDVYPPALSAVGEATMYFDPTTGKMLISENGGAYVNLV